MNILRNIAKLKNFGNRTASYLTFINSFMIISTFLAIKNIEINIFILILILVGLVIVIGYLDYVFILRYELEHINNMNDIKQDTTQILKILKK